MHICFLCNEYPPAIHGGIGSFTQTLARELVKHGHTVTAIGLYPIRAETQENDQGVAVIRLAQGTIPSLRIAANYVRMQAAIRRVHHRCPIDLLEGSERSFFLVSPRVPIPRNIRMHGGHIFSRRMLRQAPDRQKAWEERRSFRVATHICAVSRFVGETTRRELQLGDRPIPVIHNPVDLTLFSPHDPSLEEEGLLVFVGTILELKGIRQLVQALPKVVVRHSSARLIAYGRDTIDPSTGGSFMESLRTLIPHEFRDRVTFAGGVPRESLPALMARASVCVYPSHTEALPMAWVEALAMGKAVVASRIGPSPEVIEDGVSGLLCDPHQPESIADALVQALTSPDLRRRLGAAARQRAERLFSLEKRVVENIAYFESCTRRKDSAQR
jgi:glycosyltransferase involved in cell wall biosynthesis